MKDSGVMEPIHVSMAKMNNVAMALECARTARGILERTASPPITRSCATCNLESVYTYEGTHEVPRWRLENTLPALTPSTCNETTCRAASSYQVRVVLLRALGRSNQWRDRLWSVCPKSMLRAD